MKTKLKPCPFCGSNHIARYETANRCHYVRCEKCGCHMMDSPTERTAENKWNRRAKNA
jgi:Lar family restriction alleviation protein